MNQKQSKYALTKFKIRFPRCCFVIVVHWQNEKSHKRYVISFPFYKTIHALLFCLLKFHE